MRVYLRDQNELYNSILRVMRDTTNARWTQTELYDAINESLNEWHGRVSFPCLYSLGVLSDSQVYYTLPYYIKGDVTPQFLDSATYNTSNESLVLTGDESWKQIPVYDVDYSTEGTLSVEVPNQGSTSARVVYWATNGPLPRPTNTVYSGDWAADATSLRVGMTDVPQTVPDVGYVHVNREWIFYAGVTYNDDGVTLLNAQRAQDGTTAAVHSEDDAVYWGIAINDTKLLTQLQSQVRYKLHTMYLTDASPHEIELHTWLRRDGMQQVSDFWRTYVPMKRPKRHLTGESYIRTRTRRERTYVLTE